MKLKIFCRNSSILSPFDRSIQFSYGYSVGTDQNRHQPCRGQPRRKDIGHIVFQIVFFFISKSFLVKALYSVRCARMRRARRVVVNVLSKRSGSYVNQNSELDSRKAELAPLISVYLI